MVAINEDAQIFNETHYLLCKLIGSTNQPWLNQAFFEPGFYNITRLVIDSMELENG
jgi:hypothetical protein